MIIDSPLIQHPPAAPDAALLQVENLVKRYADNTAVDGVSFSVRAGSCFGLLGPNGAGKTTTIEIMEGILAPTAGTVRYRGAPLGERFRAEAGILFQKTALQDFLTVRQTLQMFRGLYDQGLSVLEVVRLCALEKLLERDNKKLSGGQLQRLLLGVALINDPAILFLDEPTTGLDPQARRRFWELVQSIKAQRKTIILTTHYMEEAQLLCDEIVIVDHGRIIAQGEPQALLRQHFKAVLLELPLEDWTPAARELGLSFFEAAGRIELTTNDLEGTLRTLMQAGISLAHLRIRPPNLEDLFLELTGKDLRA
ncbi:MAG TPA: ABC transporter ATP-binding protein [Steroidobacteraceae bacterium]|jgi:ABC-2 type transport system ATP-binding protein